MHAFGEDSGSQITIFATSSFSKSSLFVTDQPNRRTAAFLNSFGVVWMDILGANLVAGGGWAVSKPNFLHSTTEKKQGIVQGEPWEKKPSKALSTMQ